MLYSVFKQKFISFVTKIIYKYNFMPYQNLSAVLSPADRVLILKKLEEAGDLMEPLFQMLHQQFFTALVLMMRFLLLQQLDLHFNMGV